MLQKNPSKLKISVGHGKKKSKFDKRRAFNKDVGPGKKIKINKRRAYVYSGLKSNVKPSKSLCFFKWIRIVNALSKIISPNFAFVQFMCKNS